MAMCKDVVALWIFCVLYRIQETDCLTPCPDGMKTFVINFPYYNETMTVYIRPEEIGPNNTVVTPETGLMGSGNYLTLKGKQKYIMNDVDFKRNFTIQILRFQARKCKTVVMDFYASPKSKKAMDWKTHKWVVKRKAQWSLFNYEPAEEDYVEAGMVKLRFIATRTGGKKKQNEWMFRDFSAGGCIQDTDAEPDTT